MENLQTDVAAIEAILQGIEGLDPRVIKKYFEEGPARAGIHFYLIQYAPGEVIMAKGTTSDYAAVHVQGVVRVRDVVPPNRTSGPGCWDRPLKRRLENLVLRQGQTLAEQGRPPRRLLGPLSWPLAAMYRCFPEVPLRLAQVLPGPVSRLWKNHVARTLQGRLHVPRAERQLSKPISTVSAQVMQDVSEIVIRTRDEHNNLFPVERRFMGVSSTLWNQVRSVTLVADNDALDDNKPCVMLLIKRKALEEIVKKSPKFYEVKMAEFIETTLPDILARNRLFRDVLFVEDVRSWHTLVQSIQGEFSGSLPGVVDRVRKLLDPKVLNWLKGSNGSPLDNSAKAYLVEGLTALLSRRDLFPTNPISPEGLRKETAYLLNRPRASLNDCESFRLNRLILEAALPGVFVSSPTPSPMTREDFRRFTRELAHAHHEKLGTVLKPDRLENKDRRATKKGTLVFKQGDPADSVYLILTGMVRVSMNLAGGQTMVNNLGEDTYFGESAVLEGPGMPVRTANVETLCNSTLLRLDRDILRGMFEGPYRSLGERLKRMRLLFSSRDEHIRLGQLLPPSEPPLHIAERVMLTRNVLLIDMHRCTRCDQCVRGCAEAHDMQPRFHRANPELRFGKWEIAGACLHCLDSPCQQVCPVGAITLLDDMAVQIHRDRCIGCSQCAHECPFGVIDMYHPTSPADAPSSKKGIVANKCDLCLTDDYDPPCVATCPYDAAKRVDPLEFFQDLKGWANIAGRKE